MVGQLAQAGEQEAQERPHQKLRVVTPDKKISDGLTDIARGAGEWRVWSSMAMEDLRKRYHRAAFGILWVFLSFLAFIVVKAIVFNRFSGAIEFSFPIYLASGFLVWQYMNGIVTDGADVFTSAANWLQGIPVPLSIFVFQSIVRSLVTAAYSFLVVILLFIYENHNPGWGVLWVLPGILMLIFTSIWVQLLLGTISTRYRDIKHLIQTVMRISFFLTPVLWVPSAMGKLGEYTYWNPFANFIEIIRMPLLYGHADSSHWLYVGSFSLAGAVLAAIVFSYWKSRIIYWI